MVVLVCSADVPFSSANHWNKPWIELTQETSTSLRFKYPQWAHVHSTDVTCRWCAHGNALNWHSTMHKIKSKVLSWSVYHCLAVKWTQITISCSSNSSLVRKPDSSNFFSLSRWSKCAPDTCAHLTGDIDSHVVALSRGEGSEVPFSSLQW